MNEAKVIELLNKAQYNFEKMDDKFSRYDAFDPDLGVMLEIKCRKKHYDDTLLEKIKYDWNKQFAIDNSFEFLYAVSMPDKEGDHNIYLFNPIDLEGAEYDFGWHTKKLPKNTAFRGREWVDKEVGYLHIKDALVAFKERVKH
jgi:hypothetical protein